MITYEKVSVSFTCQPMGYEGSELKDIYPEFGTDYSTMIGYQWQSCANGPESWDLILKISGVAALVGKGFLEELTKDLYKWCRDRLLTMISKRKNNVGYVAVKFDDLTISIDSSHPNEDLLEFLEAIPNLYQNADKDLCSHWTIEPDELGAPRIRPLPYSVGVEIQERGGDADQVTISEAIASWEASSTSQQIAAPNSSAKPAQHQPLHPMPPEKAL